MGVRFALLTLLFYRENACGSAKCSNAIKTAESCLGSFRFMLAGTQRKLFAVDSAKQTFEHFTDALESRKEKA